MGGGVVGSWILRSCQTHGVMSGREEGRERETERECDNRTYLSQGGVGCLRKSS